jgi:TolA-binding protein
VIRAEDPEDLSLRITRSVPAWTLLGALVVLVASAVTLQLGQSSQEKQMITVVESLRELDKKLHVIGDRISSMERKDLEQDFRLRDMEGRLQSLEQRTIANERALINAAAAQAARNSRGQQ